MGGQGWMRGGVTGPRRLSRPAAVKGRGAGITSRPKGGLGVIPLARADREGQTGGGASREKKLHRSFVT